MGYSGCPKVDLRGIRANVEPDHGLNLYKIS